MNLSELKVGQSAVVKNVGGEGALRQHFLDMGVIPGVGVTVVKFAPLGDPVEIKVHDYELTLRMSEAAQIEVGNVLEKGETDDGQSLVRRAVNDIKNLRREERETWDEQQADDIDNKDGKKLCKREHGKSPHGKTEHPGLGEGGRFHPKGSGDPLPQDTVISFALVGNQNSGKTTLFNQLTGSNQHVGNFPGVTVDRKDGVIKGYPNTLVTDLPGIYSMSPYSKEEIVSRNFVLKEKPKGIINIVDATNIERNLYLTMQLIEMNVPMVVALNMMDEVRENGGSVDVNRMEEMLGVPVVPISAAKNQGVHELVEHAVHVAYYREKP